MLFRIKLFSIILQLFFCAPSWATLSADQEAAKKEGVILHNQYKAAYQQLKIAADAGDAESQYYLAEQIRHTKQFITPEALVWYEKSAAQGDIYAMIQLGRKGSDLCNTMNNCPTGHKDAKQWLSEANAVALPKAEAGNAEAMYLMYHLSGDDAWLRKSADAGYPLAQYWMGISVRQGDGFFLLPGQRENSVKQWMKASAEGNYPKGMMAYAAILGTNGDMDGYRTWTIKAAEAGYASSVFAYGTDSGKDPNELGFPVDRVKSYGLLLLLSELDGGGGMQDDVKYELPKITAKMTPEQKAQGETFAKGWKSTHPPLSFFPEKLDY